jgi:hypothetical protein
VAILESEDTNYAAHFLSYSGILIFPFLEYAQRPSISTFVDAELGHRIIAARIRLKVVRPIMQMTDPKYLAAS